MSMFIQPKIHYMKKLLLASSLFIVFGSISVIKAQDASAKITIKESRSFTFSAKDNTTTLEGNVSIVADKLSITKAEKIVVEKVKNKITVYGSCDFTFSGTVVRAPKVENQPITLEYTVGEDTVYLK